jgi:hypothetical protein
MASVRAAPVVVAEELDAEALAPGDAASPDGGSPCEPPELALILSNVKAASACIVHHARADPLLLCATVHRYGTLCMADHASSVPTPALVPSTEGVDRLRVERKAFALGGVVYDRVYFDGNGGLPIAPSDAHATVSFVCEHNADVTKETVRHDAFAVFNLDAADAAGLDPAALAACVPECERADPKVTADAAPAALGELAVSLRVDEGGDGPSPSFLARRCALL